MGNSPQPAITIPDNEVIRDEDVVRYDKPSIGKRIGDWWKTPTADMPMQRRSPAEPKPPDTFRSPSQRLGDAETSVAIASLPVIGAGAVTAPLATGLGVAGSLVGGYGGSKLGRWGGEKVGAPELGEDVGGLVGAVLGGGIGGKLGMREPAVEPIKKGPFSRVSESPVPGGYKGPPKPIAAPKPIAPSPFGGMTSTATPTGTAELPSIPQGSPTPFPEVTPKLGASQGSRLGGGGGVTTLPEPRATLPSDRPGSMWSVERETLPSRALRRQPGAGEVLQNISPKPVLYEPSPSVGTADPDFQALQGRSGLFGSAEPPDVNPPSTEAPAPPFAGAKVPPTERPFGVEQRKTVGTSPTGAERRAGVADWQRAIETTPPGQPTPGEELESGMRQSRGGAPSGVSEGDARNYLMKQPGMWEKFKAADEAGQRRMLIEARDAVAAQ